ncbi:hypothetical protein [Streptomyces sp. NPDC020362]|uniref:hypothetical protein n=1 Tax=unclassified Streptomyces TaxID=2593676 RepID=UPI0033CAF9D3
MTSGLTRRLGASSVTATLHPRLGAIAATAALPPYRTDPAGPHGPTLFMPAGPALPPAAIPPGRPLGRPTPRKA